MIFLELFWVFTKIGIVNFGGGYAMLSLIQAEVVQQHGWLTAQEFTDIVAVSQMTPGPIGINTATYVGYTSVVEAGYSPLLGAVGSLVATLGVVWLPFTLMIALSFVLLRHKDKPLMRSLFGALRPTIVGLIAAAALILMTPENFGRWETSPLQLVISLVLFVAGFVAVYRYKQSPLLVLSVAALLGLLIYSLLPPII
ncbi:MULTISPECIES: chromate transporter [unclassified Porphyromonas]|uniref:chromate transporter n=1 Tax=unclassified Porphyromonas TaxID=2645799 RepID=UPI00052C510D|nr:MULTISPECIES: chromate transporter [unclassified Porphyromonas]KGN84665.1 chromate transporter [Porphyromonas sp. COT-290 OH860]KGN97175.1 chromate transporter [Porphyromonas sp. COT-290 OH3588]